MKVTFLPSSPAPALKFSADIRLVGRKEFQQIVSDQRSTATGLHWTDHHRKITQQVRCKQNGLTEEAYDCTNLTLYGPKKTSVLHLWPQKILQPREYKKVQAALIKDSNVIRMTTQAPRAFLCGGWSFPFIDDDNTNLGTRSRLLHRKIRSALRWQAQIPKSRISELWGRRTVEANGSSSLIVLPRKKEIVVNLSLDDPNEDILSLAELKRTVSRIIIASGDRLITTGKTTRGHFINIIPP